MFRFNFAFQLCKIWFRRILFWFLHLEMWLWCYVIHLEEKTTMMDRFFDIQNSSAHFTSKVGCAERDLKVEFLTFLISQEKGNKSKNFFKFSFNDFHLPFFIASFFMMTNAFHVSPTHVNWTKNSNRLLHVTMFAWAIANTNNDA